MGGLLSMEEILAHKFIAVLNKKISIAKLFNALGHMTAGLAAHEEPKALMRFDTYIDKDGGEHKQISDLPFIILQADNSNQIRKLRAELINAGIHCVDFTSTMTDGGYVAQKEKTKNTPELELEYFGVCMFGEGTTLAAFTKKFSLWRE